MARTRGQGSNARGVAPSRGRTRGRGRGRSRARPVIEEPVAVHIEDRPEENQEPSPVPLLTEIGNVLLSLPENVHSEDLIPPSEGIRTEVTKEVRVSNPIPEGSLGSVGDAIDDFQASKADEVTGEVSCGITEKGVPNNGQNTGTEDAVPQTEDLETAAIPDGNVISHVSDIPDKDTECAEVLRHDAPAKKREKKGKKKRVAEPEIPESSTRSQKKKKQKSSGISVSKAFSEAFYYQSCKEFYDEVMQDREIWPELRFEHGYYVEVGFDDFLTARHLLFWAKKLENFCPRLVKEFYANLQLGVLDHSSPWYFKVFV